jgi:hypothetical protein
MSQSEMLRFLERLKSDERLREQVQQAEREAATRTQPIKDNIDAASRENWDSLQRIAQEHGYDISMDLSLPRSFAEPTDQELTGAWCLLTCCWVATSVWDGEGIPTVDGPQCGPGTTQFCI